MDEHKFQCWYTWFKKCDYDELIDSFINPYSVENKDAFNYVLMFLIAEKAKPV